MAVFAMHRTCGIKKCVVPWKIQTLPDLDSSHVDIAGARWEDWECLPPICSWTNETPWHVYADLYGKCFLVYNVYGLIHLHEDVSHFNHSLNVLFSIWKLYADYLQQNVRRRWTCTSEGEQNTTWHTAKCLFLWKKKTVIISWEMTDLLSFNKNLNNWNKVNIVHTGNVLGMMKRGLLRQTDLFCLFLPSCKKLVLMLSYPFAIAWNTNLKGWVLPNLHFK